MWNYTNLELKNHLLFEFNYYNNNVIKETRGVINGIETVVQSMLEMVSKQLHDTFITHKPTYKKYNGLGIKTFFNEYILTVSAEISHKMSYKGEFHYANSFEQKNDKIICKPHIDIQISANSENDLRYAFSFAVGHELTHAYNLYQYAKTYGIDNMKQNVSYQQKYRNIRRGMNPYVIINYRAVALMLYHLNRMERNAYIAQLKQELLSKKDEIKDSETAFDAIKTTESYKKFLNLENNVNLCLSDEMTTTAQNEITYALNSIMEKKFTNYNQVRNYFSDRWRKWKKAYLIKASKIANDIYQENNMSLDGDFMNKNITINKNTK